MSGETLTSAEICRRYKITRAGLRAWRQDPTFPAPLEWHPRRGGIWDRQQIADWRKRKQDARNNRKASALRAYQRRAGQHGALTETAAACDVNVRTLRRWIEDAGLELPRGA